MRTGISILVLLLSLSAQATVSHENKKVEIIHSGDNRGCFFFKLEGVSVADAAVADNPWFSVQLSRETAREIFSMLVTAKAAGQQVMVKTSGKAVCGHAEVKSVRF